MELALDYLFPILYIIVIAAVTFWFESTDSAEQIQPPTPVQNLTAVERELYDLEDKVKTLSAKAASLNHPDSLVEHTKTTRQLLKAEKERDKLRVQVKEQINELGGNDRASEASVKQKFKDIKKNASRNKLLIAIVLSYLLDRTARFAFDADQLFPLEYLIGNKDPEDGHYVFRPTFFFCFLVVRLSNRLQTLGTFVRGFFS